MLTQQYNDIKKIKEYLSKKGFKEDKGVIEKMFKQKKKNKKGYMVDPRILWWIIILIILYLLWKSDFFAHLLG